MFSDYRLQASKNAFLDLNPYLELVPELQAHYATYSETALQDCEIAGGLYGIPQFGMGTIKDINEGFFTGKICERNGGYRRLRIWRAWRPICTGQRRMCATVIRR